MLLALRTMAEARAAELLTPPADAGSPRGAGG
jgi:hypothetical protein